MCEKFFRLWPGLNDIAGTRRKPPTDRKFFGAVSDKPMDKLVKIFIEE
jgi:hypothetical protein